MEYEEVKRAVEKHFTCNPETGDVLRRISTNRAQAGTAAGHRMVNGYMAVTLPGIRKKVYCHHVIFYLEQGIWAPEVQLMIDHINTRRDDNRISNLRLANGHLNSANSSLPTGASPYRTKAGIRYRSQLRLGGIRTERAGFLTAEEASEWYRAEKERLLPELIGQVVRA